MQSLPIASARRQAVQNCEVSAKPFLYPVLVLFSSTAPCYLLIFLCYSMGHLWAAVPQECPCPAMSCSLTVSLGCPAPSWASCVLQKHILLNIVPSSKSASLAMSTKMTFSLFYFATSTSPSMCPHDYHFPLNMSEAGCQELPFRFGTQWDGHISVRADGIDFGEIYVMIFLKKILQYFKFLMCTFWKNIKLNRNI